jgi:uncharacterized protein RhaS with RHS repeats
LYPLSCILLLLLGVNLSHPVQACSLQFTSPARGSTVASSQVGVSGTGSGNANSGDQGQVTAYINGTPFFSQSGTFTTLINFLGSGAASVTLQKGANTLSVSGSVNGCSASDSMVVYYQPAPAQAQKNAGAPEVCNGTNPINDATGNKFQLEADYQGTGDFPLQLARYYNSAYSDVRALGKSWRHTYERELYFDSAKTNAFIIRPDGKAYRFTKSGGLWLSDGDINDRFTAQTDTAGTLTGWQLFKGDENGFEYYDSTDRLTVLTNRHGQSQDISYDGAGRIATVTDRTTQRALSFAYDSNNRLGTVTDPGGAVYTYAYDTNGRLAQVVWPGAIPGNPSRQYLYNEPVNTSSTNLPYALTGILDENGGRYATYRYDAQGRGIASEHANGIDLHQLNYNADGSTLITDALDHDRIYRYQTVLGVKHSAGQNQPAGSGCAASASHLGYDANGNIASRTDFNGNLGCYAYDLNRNLETVRVEGLAAGSICPADLAAYTPTGSQRKVTTQWHAAYRLPSQIDQANQRSTFSYDANGNLLAKTLTDTAIQQSRTWTYTYNALGQIVTADGPRTDVNDLTSYTYYADTTANHHHGDLHTFGNALGHVTTFTDYDANGRLLSLTDPNGLVISFAYDLLAAANDQSYSYDGLNRLIAANGTAQQSYQYDPVGNRLADDLNGATTQYQYDLGSQKLLSQTGAHPNTVVSNAVGNITQTGGKTYLYAPDQRLTSVKQGSSDIARYSYDAQGRRKSKTVGTATTHYDYDLQGRLLGEDRVPGDYVYLDGEPLARVDYNLSDWSGNVASWNIAYYHNNPLGAPLQTTDRLGQISWSAQLDPFGKATPINPAITQNLRLPGQYYDQETGLHYNMARYYDPVNGGRYLQSDPIGLSGGINTYAYVENNPLSYIDPLGLDRTYAVGQRLVTFPDGQMTPAESAIVEAGFPEADGPVSPVGVAATTAEAALAACPPGRVARGGLSSSANFAQRTFREGFSAGGRRELSAIAGQPIRTVDDLANAIRGGLEPSKIPVNVIERGGNTLILNTRTVQALERAGVPRSSFNVINRTGDEFFEGLLSGQLQHNNPTSGGISSVVRG